MKIVDIEKASRNHTRIQGLYVLSDCSLHPFKNRDGNFFQCILKDSTGYIKGVLWDYTEREDWLKDNCVVSLEGSATRYNDVPQVVINKIKLKTSYNPSELMPSLEIDTIKSIQKELISISKTIEDEVYKKIWEKVMEKDFMLCPGGVGAVHHNYIGGLAEHSLGMIRTAGTLQAYQSMDRDLLLTGCLIHDIGKIKTYRWSLNIEMTDMGRLLHHTYLGYGMLLDIARDLCIDSKDSRIVKLLHIIVSHHENEGIRVPMFPEANAISNIDAMDAAVNHSISFTKNTSNKKHGTNWSVYCNLTQRSYYMGEGAKDE